MNREWKLRIEGAFRAFLYGSAGAVLIALVVFLVGFLWGGLSWARGYEWQRFALYVLGACGIIVCAIGMLSAGGKTREEQLDPQNFSFLESMERFPGISWAAALFWASLGPFFVETLIELVFYSIF